MEKEIRTYISDICRAQHVHLLDVSVHGGGRNRIVRIIVDTDKGITLDQCERLSRDVADIFFRRNLFDGNYQLEVTSPGVEKPLEADYEFMRNVGRTVHVEYMQENELRDVTGALKSYQNGQLELETPAGPVHISRDKLKKAKVKLKW